MLSPARTDDSEASGVTRVGGGSAHGIGGVRGEAVLRRAVLPRVAAEEVAAWIIPIAPVAGVRDRRLEGVPVQHLPAEEEVEVIEAHSRRALAPTSTTTHETRTLASGGKVTELTCALVTVMRSAE